MTQKTPLETAFAAMSAAPEDGAARAAYYAAIVASDLVVLLSETPGETFKPECLELDGEAFAICFDDLEKLAAFCDAPAPYVEMPGGDLVAACVTARIGLALDPGFESAHFLPPSAVTWAAQRLGADVAAEARKPRRFAPPRLEAPHVLSAIDQRLAAFMGPGRRAALVWAEYEEGNAAHLMVIEGIAGPERAALAGALAETLRLAAPDLALDTGFEDRGSARAEAAARVGLIFDMHQAEAPPRSPSAPGSDPARPPKLR